MYLLDRPADYVEELPEEMQELIEKIRIEKQMRIQTLGRNVAAKLQEAITGRRQEGVEKIWQEDRDYYEGVDDYNKPRSSYTKSASTSGGVQRNPSEAVSGCTAFFNITRQFCDAGSARMGDILLPAGDWNFSVKPSPVPDDIIPDRVEKDFRTAVPEAPVIPNQTPEEGQFIPAPPSGLPPTPASLSVEDKTEKAETRIKDWLVECAYHAEARKVLEDSAITGTGILKGPVPTLRKTKRAQTDENGNVTLVMVEETVPASFHVNPKNFFPDPACGENIHNGDYVFEKDTLSAKRLRELKDAEGYLPEQIDKVIDEGPGKKNYDDTLRNDGRTKDADVFEIWYFYGGVDADDLDAMDVQGTKPESEKKMVPAIVTLVNDTPIKAFLNPMDSGDFPYDVMPWQRIEGCWYGIGVARQGRTAQDMFNASARALMNNSALSSEPMIVIREKMVRPADKKWEMTRGKIWLATEEADIKSVKDAFQAVNIPTMQVELLNNMQEARRGMEDATGIYFIMQGQQGEAPDTVGGMQILNRNSFVFFRRLARVFDECVTERHIRRYYEWLMEYGEDSEKGDAQIEATGSTALVEREIYAMQAMGMLNISLNPAFGMDPEKAAEEVLKAQRFNPDKWKLDDEKKAQIAQQPPPLVPQVEAAKIRAEVELLKTQMNNELKALAIQNDTDRDTVYSQGVARRDETNAQLKIQELVLKRELAMLDYANKNGMSLDKIKADLAQTAMKLNLQERLAISGVGGEVLTPPIEPGGRAPEGEAFQK